MLESYFTNGSSLLQIGAGLLQFRAAITHRGKSITNQVNYFKSVHSSNQRIIHQEDEQHCSSIACNYINIKPESLNKLII